MNLDTIKRNYGILSRIYDTLANAILLWRDDDYRLEYVNALSLNEGDSVLDIAGGTGLNLEYLIEAVGKDGEIWAVDITLNQLDIYRRKGAAYKNVHLVEGDVTNLSQLPLSKKPYDAILCTYAMCVIPDYEKAIADAVEHLKPGGKFVVSDFKLVTGALGIFNLPVWAITSPWVGPYRNLKRPIKQVMEAQGLDVEYNEFFVGNMLYMAVGKKPL